MSRYYKFGLLGENISYSKSGDIFKAIFDIMGIQGSFENFDLNALEFENGFRKLVNQGIDGLSVTIPFKARIIPVLDEVNPIAKSLGAVNSIANVEGKLHGHNTDIFGFSSPLKRYAEQIKKGHALILGSGGSARAAGYALYTDFEILQFTIAGRSPEKLLQFKKLLEEILPNSQIATVRYDEFQNKYQDIFNIVINCTPLGGVNQLDLSPIPKGFSWSRTQMYYDLNYNVNNQSVCEAIDSGLMAFDGSQMLVTQAVRSFEIWTGLSVSFDEVYDRVFDKSKQAAS